MDWSDNFIPSASTSAHVTAIELGLLTNGAFYTMNVLGDGVARTPQPSNGCTLLTGGIYTFSIDANERVTKMEVWRNSDDYWYRFRLTLNSDVQLEYDTTPAGTSSYLYTLKIDAGYEFLGFGFAGARYICKIIDLDTFNRPATCSASIDLSSFSGSYQNIFADVTQTKLFSVTHMYCGPDIDYQVTVSPNSATPGLISLSTTSAKTMVFA
jgi:hypothetical protein